MDIRSQSAKAAPATSPSDKSKSGWIRPYHPFLLAAFFVLSLYAANWYETPLRDVLLPLIVVLSSAALILAIARLVFPSWDKAAIATSLLLVVILGYGHLRDIGKELVPYVGEWVFNIPMYYRLIVPGVLALIFLLFLYRARLNEPRVTRVLNVISAILVATTFGSLGYSYLSNPLEQSHDTDATAAEQPIHLVQPDAPPDIYYLVFDRYAGSQTLREDYGFDNSQFEEQLRRRGFFVAQESFANYPKTVIAMASVLNLRYHDEVTRPHDYYAQLLQHHRVGRLLKEQGYRYHFFGNWYSPMRSIYCADVNHYANTLPTEFANVLYQMSLLSVIRSPNDDPQQILESIAELKQVATEPGPKFVHAHFLLPHPPYRFDRDGTIVSPAVRAQRTRKENYINQLQFTNMKILEMIDQIQAHATVPPIIVIQADEGPYLTAEDQQRDRRAQISKRSRIISAFCLPGVDMPATIGHDITPVNTFRLIFKHYFDADIPLLKDRKFYWETPNAGGVFDYGLPNRFVDVTDELGPPSGDSR